MTQRLTAALADRYAIRRELGRGGMATVYLAEDVRHERLVALKVLRPELAAALGPERFLREIKYAAGLRHPHILPLYDSGEADGLLFYVMPYVSGESLRDRLDRERQLPLDDACRIAREVADGLSFAHSHGVVHRDIKPENILLEAGHAVIADFGIARAISAAGGERLTETGLAIGTPSYMSPEQAAGRAEIDGRSDLYSLACVLYEMLAGQPPYTGPTAASVVQQHLAAALVPVSTVRPAVPENVVAALARALAKTPADRFGTTVQFAEELAGVASPPHRAPGPARKRRVWTLVGAAVVGAAILVLGGILFWPRPSPIGDPAVVAILPFRVAAADPSLEYLREGVVDLLAAKLTGEGGPRAVDPRTAINAWQRAGGSSEEDLTQAEAIAVAERVDAGMLLLGSVVGTGDHVEMQARLLGVPSGEPRSHGQVTGEPDSLPWLVDDLASQLLARQAGEGEQRLVQLTSTSLPALRAYLDGQAAYRRGLYTEAAGRFNRALDLDSTFALAGLGLVAAQLWAASDWDFRGMRLGWRHRDRLSERDRVLLTAITGPEFPQPTTYRQQLEGFARATALAPDRPDPWYWLGEWYFHFGPALGMASSSERAGDAFRRAFALDSSFLAPVEHLLDLAVESGDQAAVESLANHYLGVDSTGDMADFVRWKRAIAAGDSLWFAAFLDRLDEVATSALWSISAQSMLTGRRLQLADRIVDILAHRTDPPAERLQSLVRMRVAALDRGRPQRAHALLLLAEDAGPPPSFVPAMTVLDALFGGGDTAAAAIAADRLRSLATRSFDEMPGAPCVSELWRTSRGRFETTRQVITRLRAVTLPKDREATARDRRFMEISRVCTTVLEALLATHEARADAPEALARLDSVMRAGPVSAYELTSAGNLTAARLFEQRGDLEAALDAVRRRVHHFGTYESTHLREEGRLAALLGDREEAIAAYERYLTLRSDPEPSVAPEVEAVRQALARLIAEPGSGR